MSPRRPLTPARTSIGVATLLASLALTACAPAASTTGKQTVLASFYPLAFVAERVGGDLVDVDLLTPPGAEPHDVELSPAQVRGVGEADLVVYLSGFQAAVDQAITARAPEHVVDAADAGVLHDDEDAGLAEEDGHDDEAEDADHDHEFDPHFWLDPTRLTAVAGHVADALGAIDPENATTYEDAATALAGELQQLDADFVTGLATCETSAFVTTHAAFGYLAERYGLEQIAISGIEPSTEPSPARLREVADALAGRDVTTIFTETLVSPKVAQVLAADLGMATDVLDPIGGLADVDADVDYLSIMRANLEALRTAMRCA